MMNPDVRLSRRSLLVGAGGALLTAGLGSYLTSNSGAKGGGTTTESLDGWLAPVTRASAGGELSTQLHASKGQALIGTKDALAMTYEDMYPGPTFEVKPGDRLKVKLINDTGQVTNLHTHGLHVSPNSPSDNV